MSTSVSSNKSSASYPDEQIAKLAAERGYKEDVSEWLNNLRSRANKSAQSTENANQPIVGNAQGQMIHQSFASSNAVAISSMQSLQQQVQ